MMGNGFTKDPGVALSGLVAIALFGVLVIGGGLLAAGLMDGAWIQMAGGAAWLMGLSWGVWRAGRVVRGALQREPT